MTKFRNMKIEINDKQPLDEVVKELERLGFIRVNHHMNSNNCMVFSSYAENSLQIDYWRSDIQTVTLAELKEM